MKNHKNVLMLLLVGSLAACVKEGTHKTTEYMVNETGHEISFTYYRDNFLDTVTKNLPVGTQVVFLEQGSGKHIGVVFPHSLELYDSVMVKFDDDKKLIHYPENPRGSNPDAIRFEDGDNLYNPKNYKEVIISESRHSAVTEYYFYFPLSVYQRAK